MHKWILAVVAIIVIVGALACYWMHRTARRGSEARHPTRIVDAQKAAKRLLCLRLFVVRAGLEHVIAQSPKEHTESRDLAIKVFAKENQKIYAKFKSDGLWKSLSRQETALLEKPMGGWTEQEITDGSWWAEALAVIEWALGEIDQIPPYDKEVDREAFSSKLKKIESYTRYVADAKLRPDAEIAKARDVAEFWLWRARTGQIQKDPKKYPLPKDVTLEEIISKAAAKGEEDGLFKAIENDFPAFGKPFAKLSDDELWTMQSIAAERLYGLNWLCGYSEDWDEVPTDT